MARILENRFSKIRYSVDIVLRLKKKCAFLRPLLYVSKFVLERVNVEHILLRYLYKVIFCREISIIRP